MTLPDRTAGRRLTIVVLVLLCIRLALPLVTLHHSWELHRDELLYFAMADHFDLFRMQFPPLIAAVAGTGRAVFGESLWAARVPAALAGAALTGVVLWLVRRLHGGLAHIIVAWCAMLAAPVFVRSSVLLQPVIFDQLWATIAITALILAAHEHQPRWWLGVGVGLGLGALTKFSVAFVAVAIVVAAASCAPLRGQFRTRWPWMAAALALVLAVPSLSGQILHDWPFLQQMKTLQAGQLQHVSRLSFLIEQPGLVSGGLLCILPAVWAAVRREPAPRVAVVTAVTMLLLLCILRGKAYYAAPVYPPLIALGSVALVSVSTHRLWVVRGAVGVMLCVAALLWPVAVPMLDAGNTARYFTALGISERTNRGEAVAVPQDFADMTGWKAMASAVHDVVMQLPESERARVTLVGGNYGEAGALAFYQPQFGYPYPRSTAGDFWAWGPGSASGDPAIVLGEPASVGATLRALYDSVEVRRVLRNPVGVREERELAIFLARHSRQPLAAVWAQVGPNWH